MNINFSDKLREILSYSREEAIRLGNDYISVDHLFLGILRDGDCTATHTLAGLNVDAKKSAKSWRAGLSSPLPLPKTEQMSSLC